MKVTTLRNKDNEGGFALSVMDFAQFIQRISHDTSANYIVMLRDEYYRLAGRLTRYRYYEQIPDVRPLCQYCRKRSGEIKMVEYNGLVMIEVEGLNNSIEVEETKREAALLPQTLCAIEGCDGHSVVVLARVTLPDGGVPKGGEQLDMFLMQAYRTAVMCYAPMLSFPITIKRPAPDMAVKMPLDAQPYVNHHATPFIIEQPVRYDADLMPDVGLTSNPLDRLSMDAGAVVSMHEMFAACHSEAMIQITEHGLAGDPMAEVSVIAQCCRRAGLPEEEATRHILWHYYKERETDVRSMVRVAYDQNKAGVKSAMPKKQAVALMLREFLSRRYEIRYNEVKGVTEYKRRQSLDFMYHELTKRDRNTIRHEAALEGIEAFDSEVDGLLDSNYVPRYNPVADFLGSVGAWDGRDYIGELAARVPNNNKHWVHLFTRWFLSMVAHWMGYDRDHSNSTAPILIGAQGFHKSTFCRILLPPELRDYYTDGLDMRNKIEAERSLGRFLLINIDEFDQLSDSQFAQVKHLFQKPEVSVRRSYSSVIETHQRYASFIATTNQTDVLRDPTGNRRYLCVEVTAPIQTDLPLNYKQLYAQAVAYIRDGKQYWIDAADEALINSANRQFEQQSPLEHIVRTCYSVPEAGETFTLMKITDIMMRVKKNPLFKSDMNNLIILGRIMTKMSFEKQRKRDGWYYVVHEIGADTTA